MNWKLQQMWDQILQNKSKGHLFNESFYFVIKFNFRKHNKIREYIIDIISYVKLIDVKKAKQNTLFLKMYSWTMPKYKFN